MKRMALILALLLICGLLPAVSNAGPIPPGRWWRLPNVAERLDLKAEEKKKLDELFVQERRKLIDLKSAVERERFELENLIEQETIDDAAALEQYQKLEKARSALSHERFLFLLEARKLLGLERYQLVKDLYRVFRNGKRHHHKRMPWRDMGTGKGVMPVEE